MGRWERMGFHNKNVQAVWVQNMKPSFKVLTIPTVKIFGPYFMLPIDLWLFFSEWRRLLHSESLMYLSTMKCQTQTKWMWQEICRHHSQVCLWFVINFELLPACIQTVLDQANAIHMDGISLHIYSLREGSFWSWSDLTLGDYAHDWCRTVAKGAGNQLSVPNTSLYRNILPEPKAVSSLSSSRSAVRILQCTTFCRL